MQERSKRSDHDSIASDLFLVNRIYLFRVLLMAERSVVVLVALLYSFLSLHSFPFEKEKSKVEEKRPRLFSSDAQRYTIAARLCGSPSVFPKLPVPRSRFNIQQ